MRRLIASRPGVTGVHIGTPVDHDTTSAHKSIEELVVGLQPEKPLTLADVSRYSDRWDDQQRKKADIGKR